MLFIHAHGTPLANTRINIHCMKFEVLMDNKYIREKEPV